MVGIGGARPVVVAGGGGVASGPYLIGAAEVVRQNNQTLPNGTWTKLIGFDFERAIGDVGSVDIASGRIMLPAGCKMIRVNTRLHLNGAGSPTHGMRFAWDGADDENAPNLRYSINSQYNLWGEALIDVSSSSWLDLYILARPSSGSVVLEGAATAYDKGLEGHIEFFGDAG